VYDATASDVRETQVDPIGAGAASIDDPQTWNMYSYVANDPINRTDPSGLFFKKLFKWISKALKIIVIAVAVAVLVLAIASGFGVPGAFTALKAIGLVLGKIGIASKFTSLGFLASVETALGSTAALLAASSAGLGTLSAIGAVAEFAAQKEEGGKTKRRREKDERRRRRETGGRRLPTIRVPDLPEIRTEPQQGKPEARVPPRPEMPGIDPENPPYPRNGTRAQKIGWALSRFKDLLGGPITIMVNPEIIQDAACRENPYSYLCINGPYPGCCRRKGPVY
jgi:hypothetical protein